MKKSIFGLIIGVLYFGGLYGYYEHQDKLFIENLKKAVNTGDSTYLDAYTTMAFDEDIYQELEDKEAIMYSEAAYEWEVLIDSVENIQSVAILNQTTDYSNYIFSFGRIDCYNIQYNNSYGTQYLCNRKSLNDLEIMFIF